MRIDDAPRILKQLLEVAEEHGVTRARVVCDGTELEFERIPLGSSSPEPPRDPSEYEKALMREAKGRKL